MRAFVLEPARVVDAPAVFGASVLRCRRPVAAPQGVPDRRDDEPRGIDHDRGCVSRRSPTQDDRGHARVVNHEPSQSTLPHHRHEPCDDDDRRRVAEREQHHPYPGHQPTLRHPRGIGTSEWLTSRRSVAPGRSRPRIHSGRWPAAWRNCQVSVYCWNPTALPSRMVHTWQTSASSGSPVALAVAR